MVGLEQLQEKVNKLIMIQDKRYDFKLFRNSILGFSKYKVEKLKPSEYYVLDFDFIKVYYQNLDHLKLGFEWLLDRKHQPRIVLHYILIDNRYVLTSETLVEYFKEHYL